MRGMGAADALRAAQVQAIRAGQVPRHWAGVIAIVR
jgi:hypothetical protein